MVWLVITVARITNVDQVADLDGMMTKFVVTMVRVSYHEVQVCDNADRISDSVTLVSVLSDCNHQA